MTTHRNEVPRLNADQIHVWRVPLNHDLDRLPGLRKLLSAQESKRADRFHFEKDRNQFTESHAVLRVLLASYLKASAKEVEFISGSHGKPRLTNQSAGGLHFNLSRRDGLALIAFARNREIGIDVELTRSDLEFFEIAEVSFSENELAVLKSLPESRRTAGFYNCWTRKEAFVKAFGEGLSFPLKDFDVSLAPGEPAKLLAIRGDDDEAASWTVQDVSVAKGYVAALAFKATNAKVINAEWRW